MNRRPPRSSHSVQPTTTQRLPAGQGAAPPTLGRPPARGVPLTAKPLASGITAASRPARGDPHVKGVTMRRAILVTLAAGALTALLAAQATAAQAPRKGGTFKGMFATDVDFIDPSLAYYAHSWEIMGAIGANLLRFADAEGSAGSRIVPEVAAGFPRVSGNGRTYTFTLR